jgi:hypothetical protein
MTPEETNAKYPYCSELSDLAESMPKFPDIGDVATEDIASFSMRCLVPLLTLDAKTREAMKTLTNLLDMAKRLEEAKRQMFADEFGSRLSEGGGQ